MRIRNQFGFSLVGVLVASAILGVLAMGTASLFQAMTKDQNYQKYRSELETFTEEIRGQLSSKTACFNTFGGMTLDASTAQSRPAIKDAIGNSTYVVGSQYGNRTFTLSAIRMQSYPAAVPPISWYADTDANGGGTMIVTLEFTAALNQSGPSKLARNILFQTHKDAGNALIDCISLSKMSDGIWSYNKNNLRDIYYNGGNVGVGTVSPSARLEITGSGAGTDGIHLDTISAAANTSPWGILMTNNLGNAAAGLSGIHGIEVDYAGNFRIARPQAVTPNPDFMIATNGNVGLGTGNPMRRLTVTEPAGTAVLRIESAAGPNAADLELARTGTGVTWTLSQYTDDSFQIIKNSGLPGGLGALVIDGTGNMGIGTPAPKSKLQVTTGYLQIQSISMSAPPPADCSGIDHVGRMVIWTPSQAGGPVPPKFCFCPQNMGQGYGWKCADGF